MLLVYTHKITSRLRYTFKQVCTAILGIPVKYTTAVDEFIVHDGLKVSYTTKPLGKELHIKSQEVLFEQGITDFEVNVQDWDGVQCFFPAGTKSAIPYDIFAAAFVLLSRYEEYLPHVKDENGRFPATESLAHQEKFLTRPVIDMWALRFKEVLQTAYPDFIWPKKEFDMRALIDVEQAYDFYATGIMRKLGGIVKDIAGLRFSRLFLRLRVDFGLRKDPYDTFSWLINVQKHAKRKFIYFFQLGDYSTYTTNIRFNKKSFRELIKTVGDYSDIGLLLSREALNDARQLKIEKQRITGITNKPLESVRCTSHMTSLPLHYREMVAQEAYNDYSMGYPDTLGFRASTCTPFLFYDLDYESPMPLMVHPVCAQSGVFESHVIKEAELNKGLDIFLEMLETVKGLNGHFIFSFKNKSFTGKGDDEGQWKQFFRQLVHE
ncbi:MAG: hypothetical protein CL868_04750 [Cytophagaceae bacterium]|nr:hypothetical protein [Cytophagaceae bacterium]